MIAQSQRLLRIRSLRKLLVLTTLLVAVTVLVTYHVTYRIGGVSVKHVEWTYSDVIAKQGTLEPLLSYLRKVDEQYIASRSSSRVWLSAPPQVHGLVTRLLHNQKFDGIVLLQKCYTNSTVPCRMNVCLDGELEKCDIMENQESTLKDYFLAGTSIFSHQNLCKLKNLGQSFPVVSNYQLLSPCYLFPEQISQFSDYASSSFQKTWILRSEHLLDMQLLDISKPENAEKVQECSQTPGTTIELSNGDVWSVAGNPVILTFYVLLTSMSPLQAFLHSEGSVSYIKDGQPLMWTLRHLFEQIPLQSGKMIRKNARTVILATLLLAEKQKPRSVWPEFLLLGFEMTFNSTLHPTIMNIIDSPSIKELKIKQMNDSSSHQVVEDVLRLMMSPKHAYNDLAAALKRFSSVVAIKEFGCYTSEKLCLTNRDIIYYLLGRQFMQEQSQFVQLYPIADDSLRLVKLVRSLGSSATQRLHSTSVILEQYFYNQAAREDALLGQKKMRTGLALNLQGQAKVAKKIYVKTCSNAAADLPFLSELTISPKLNLLPEFHANSTFYHASAPYSILLVDIRAATMHCATEARIGSASGPAGGSANVTLGLGHNRIVILVVSSILFKPQTISTYILIVYRKSLQEQLPSGLVYNSICLLRQDCMMKIDPLEPCGLKASLFINYEQFDRVRKSLPICQKGNEQGQWVVRCSSHCRNMSLCLWDEAIWSPIQCRIKDFSNSQLRSCMRKMQIMFIGDSTNRGMMYALLERLNGSLSDWTKSHNIKVFRSLNKESTGFGFVYYPQFWLPSNQRPAFEEALHQLIGRISELRNDHSTVLVVGGVHWLTKHHLSTIEAKLKKEKLENIRVIVKGYSAGFHQPVSGLHHLTMNQQRQSLQQNQALLEFAQQQKFWVVDTFNMTIARFRDFRPGKCACHFHQVKEVLPSFKQFSQAHTTKQKTIPLQYSVAGKINMQYTNILSHKICQAFENKNEV